jgi:hypothetical protein
MGWTQMITCMEVYVEHGINLRHIPLLPFVFVMI